VSDDEDTGRCVRARSLVGQRTDDVEAQPLLAADDPGEVFDVIQIAGDERGREELAFAARDVKAASERDSAGEQERNAEHEEQDEETPGKGILHQVGADPDRRGHEK